MGKTTELLKLVKYGNKLGRNVFKKILPIYLYCTSPENEILLKNFGLQTDQDE